MLFLSACIKKYKQTNKFCENLYIEIFNVNPAGVDSHYITDSFTFRFYVGKIDNEHENYHYMCSGDSLVIEKIASLDNSGYMRVIESRVFSFKDLKMNNKYD